MRQGRPAAQPGRRRGEESGFALLVVLAMAAAIAIMLYRELPRAAFESQRAKEQVLIDRGEEYVRAIQLYVSKWKRYPQSLDDLEQTNGQRFLRRRYKDPMTGKDEWKLLKINEAGVITNSAIQKAEEGAEQKSVNTFVSEMPGLGTSQAQAGTPEAGAAVALRRRPSEGGPPQDPNQQPFPGAQPYPGQQPYPAGQPGAQPYPAQPPYPGQPGQPYPEQPPQGFAGQPQPYPEQQAQPYPGQQPQPYPGQQPQPYPGQQHPQGFPVQPPGFPGNANPAEGDPNQQAQPGQDPNSDLNEPPPPGQDANADPNQQFPGQGTDPGAMQNQPVQPQPGVPGQRFPFPVQPGVPGQVPTAGVPYQPGGSPGQQMQPAAQGMQPASGYPAPGGGPTGYPAPTGQGYSPLSNAQQANPQFNPQANPQFSPQYTPPQATPPYSPQREFNPQQAQPYTPPVNAPQGNWRGSNVPGSPPQPYPAPGQPNTQPQFGQQAPPAPGSPGGQVNRPPGAGAPGANAATEMIQRMLTSPRPDLAARMNVPGGGGMTIGGGIAGVASTAESPSIKIYNERQKYNEWEFVYDLKKDKRLMGAMAGQMGGQQNPNLPGGQLPGGMQGGSFPGMTPGQGGPATGFGQTPQPGPGSPPIQGGFPGSAPGFPGSSPGGSPGGRPPGAPQAPAPGGIPAPGRR